MAPKVLSLVSALCMYTLTYVSKACAHPNTHEHIHSHGRPVMRVFAWTSEATISLFLCIYAETHSLGCDGGFVVMRRDSESVRETGVLGDMDQNFLKVKATQDSEDSSQSLDSLNS